MECSCSVSIYIDGNGPACHSQKIRKAKKQHRCCECRKTIQSGEQYEYFSGIWDGEPASYKTCLDCLSLRNAFFTPHVFEEMWDDFFNEFHHSDIPEKCIAGLTPVVRSKVCEWIEKCWENDEMVEDSYISKRVG